MITIGIIVIGFKYKRLAKMCLFCNQKYKCSLFNVHFILLVQIKCILVLLCMNTNQDIYI